MTDHALDKLVCRVNHSVWYQAARTAACLILAAAFCAGRPEVCNAD